MLSRDELLHEMGVTTRWRLRGCSQREAPEELRGVIQPANAPAEMQNTVAVAPISVADSDWPSLAEAVQNCRACGLCEHRTQAVLGIGDLSPDWLLVGEGPGAEEDARGEPFVGQAGRLLDNMLAALALKRGQKVYIANAVKCRPPGNRTPEPAEMAACRPFLLQQIALLKPKLIVLLGRAAAHTVLGEGKSLASLRGKVYDFEGTPVVVTYHPAYLLRNLPDKAKAWEDLLFARQVLNQLS